MKTHEQIQANKSKLALITHANIGLKVHNLRTGQNDLINKTYNPKSQDHNVWSCILNQWEGDLHKKPSCLREISFLKELDLTEAALMSSKTQQRRVL